MIHRRLTGALLSVPAPLPGAVAVPAAHAFDVNGRAPAGVSGTGIHRTYDDKSTCTYLANAVDTGTSPVELDSWHNVFNGKWDVSHSNPLGSDNNCVQAGTCADLCTGNRNQNLDSCQNGFYDTLGMSPTEFDGHVKTHLGSVLYPPAELLTKSDGTRYPDPDTAAKSNNWANYGSLAGRAMMEIIPGTFEQAVGPASSWSDVVYAQHPKDFAVAGNISRAAAFPGVLGAQSVDPRTRYSDTTLRPWFVVFDAEATAWVGDGDTEWYHTNHCLTVVTDAYDVPPALSSSAPSPADAQARVAQLAADGASYISSDWITAPADGVLGEVLTRG
ncbi:hypothetical protein AB0I51_12365 [Streptomyces sp. NPDC050549]|uniref:hypothetical protein n=1 Tax=Streptomyces sp. NPDC050549 TaxID=3155406 RepID=UPI0034206B49